MNNQAVIVVPLYKEIPSAYEELALEQCFKILGDFKIVAIKPYSLSLQPYNFNFDEVFSFDDSFFADVAGYNKLMLSSSFYETFLAYEFMLLYQPDAFVFKDELSFWCNQGYDYLGAPWLKSRAYSNLFKQTKNDAIRYIYTKFNIKQSNSDLPSDKQFQNRVGNGGLSLRNIKKFNQVCHEKKQVIEFYNSRSEYYFGEDVFWSVEANRDKTYLNIPDAKVAIRFSIEQSIDYAIQLNNGELPFGCHAWDRDVKIWKPYFRKAGIEI